MADSLPNHLMIKSYPGADAVSWGDSVARPEQQPLPATRTNCTAAEELVGVRQELHSGFGDAQRARGYGGG